MWTLTITLVVGVIEVGQSIAFYPTQNGCVTARYQAESIAHNLKPHGIEYEVRGSCVYQERA